MSPQDTNEFNHSMKCGFCHAGFEFNPSEICQDIKYKDKEWDHDHMTGRVRLSSHPSCDLRHKQTVPIQMLFHNFRGSDAHLFAKHLKNNDDHPNSVIGLGMDKNLTLSLGMDLTFKYSLQFLGASLEQIGKNLRASGMNKFNLLRAEFPCATNEQLHVVVRKHLYT